MTPRPFHANLWRVFKNWREAGGGGKLPTTSIRWQVVVGATSSSRAALDLPHTKTCGHVQRPARWSASLIYAHDSRGYGVGGCTPSAKPTCRPRAGERRGRTKMQDSRGREVTAPDLAPLDQCVQETGEADGVGSSLVDGLGFFAGVPSPEMIRLPRLRTAPGRRPRARTGQVLRPRLCGARSREGWTENTGLFHGSDEHGRRDRHEKREPVRA